MPRGIYEREYVNRKNQSQDRGITVNVSHDEDIKHTNSRKVIIEFNIPYMRVTIGGFRGNPEYREARDALLYDMKKGDSFFWPIAESDKEEFKLKVQRFRSACSQVGDYFGFIVGLNSYFNENKPKENGVRVWRLDNKTPKGKFADLPPSEEE